ncbi:MAG TPA: hypothetical protein VHZ54_02965 [Solirubrobacterales bacterium]|nr:hypothetical protein [Solirubrobacterales bacterium]
MTLDFKTPFDELRELREVLTTQEIAEMTGLRRETISRARPDSRFQQRTEKALGDLYAVVARMRSVNGRELGQLAAVLRRPQVSLGSRSIAELLKDGEVDVVLDSLSERPRIDAPSEEEAAEDPKREEREKVAAFLAAHPEVRSRVDEIEAAVLRHFGPGATVEREIGVYYDEPEPEDDLHLRVHADLSIDERIDRLGDFLGQEGGLLAPVRHQVVIGIL